MSPPFYVTDEHSFGSIKEILYLHFSSNYPLRTLFICFRWQHHRLCCKCVTLIIPQGHTTKTLLHYAFMYYLLITNFTWPIFDCHYFGNYTHNRTPTILTLLDNLQSIHINHCFTKATTAQSLLRGLVPTTAASQWHYPTSYTLIAMPARSPLQQ